MVEKCEHGPTAIIINCKKTYKNNACLSCNFQGKPSHQGGHRNVLKYSLIFGAGHYSSVITERVCPQGFLFDAKGRRCLKTYQFPHLSSLQTLKEYYIAIEYESKATCQISNISHNIQTKGFSDAIERILHNTSENTVRLLNLKVIPAPNFDIVALRIVDTVQRTGNFNTTFDNQTQTTSILYRLTLELKKTIIIETCWHKTLLIDARDVEGKTTIYLEQTQKNYSSGEFWVFEGRNGTVVVVCDRFMPMNCSYINATKESWTLFANLSLFYKGTREFYGFGDYFIKNDTAWICLSEKSLRYQPTKLTNLHSIHDEVLPTLSTIASVISIASLVSLIMIYSKFRALRNLHGKNLILMCTTLAIAQLLWLLQTQFSSIISQRCDIVVMSLQYFFLASFASSGSIAFHLYKTFYSISEGQLMGAKSKFLWYPVYSLGCPGITVAIFWLIDYFNLLKLGYKGKTVMHNTESVTLCWFDKTLGLYIAFFAPMFLQLFVNVILLLLTLKWIYKPSQGNLGLAERTGGAKHQDIGIYLRISTLMGLTWILGILLFTCPGVIAIDYLFNVVNGLQGFYIAMAFLSAKNVRKLLSYKAPKRANTSSVATINESRF